jgi:hypothetical protein
MPVLSEASAAFLAGSQYGVTLPPGPARTLPPESARHVALERLADFLATLTFSRRMERGAPAAGFKVPRENILEEQPDAVKDGRLPSIGFVPGDGVHDAIGLGAQEPIDETLDVYAKGTALVELGEYVETFMLEGWAGHRAERRALASGLLVAFRSMQETNSLRLTLPDYFDSVAEFTLSTERNIDDPDVVRGRRRVLFPIQLRVPEYLLVDAVTLKPYVAVEVTAGASLVQAVVVG